MFRSWQKVSRRFFQVKGRTLPKPYGFILQCKTGEERRHYIVGRCLERFNSRVVPGFCLHHRQSIVPGDILHIEKMGIFIGRFAERYNNIESDAHNGVDYE